VIVPISNLEKTAEAAISACRSPCTMLKIFSENPNILMALMFSGVYEVSWSLPSTFSIHRRWNLFVNVESLNVAKMKTAFHL
jgi:hypothetical protein